MARKKNPFRQRNTEVEREEAEVEAQGQGESAPETDDHGNKFYPTGNDSGVVEPSATATQPEPPAIVAPLSAIGPSELIDQLEASKTGKSKIKAGRDYITANPEATSEDMVRALGSNPRDRRGAGKLRAIGYWPPGTVAKATAILEANPAGDP